MSFLPPTLIRLVRALALHVSRCRGSGCPARARPESPPGGRLLRWMSSLNAAPSGRNFNAMRPVLWLSTWDANLLSRLRAKNLTRGSLLLPLLGRFLVCYSRRSLSRPGGQPMVWIGFLPKISTTCGKDCGKSTRALRSWTPGQVNCLCVKYFQARSGVRLPARCTYGSQYLGPNPLQNRNES